MTADIEGAPTVTDADAWRVVAGLRDGEVYRASVLYDRYRTQCAEAGRRPASPQALGQKLRVIGCSPRRKGTGAKVRRAWLVTFQAQQRQPWYS